jgi:hypothetical protein
MPGENDASHVLAEDLDHVLARGDSSHVLTDASHVLVEDLDHLLVRARCQSCVD